MTQVQSIQKFAHPWFLLVFLTCTVTLYGCEKEGPEKKFQNYLGRLATTLDADTPTVPIPLIAKPPKISELRYTLEPGNLHALDFLALSGCKIQITIGKRNSSLGKFAKDSQRLLLELEYLLHAPECIRFMRKNGKTELAENLEMAYQLKKRQLPKLIFNATLANSEFRSFWKKPAALADYPAQTNSKVLQSLGAITKNTERWLSGDYRADNATFEIHLSEVAMGDGGALWLALGIQGGALNAGNILLEQSLARGPLCSKNYRSPAADILPRVVHKYFITQIQPGAAALGKRYHELIPALRALENLLQDDLPKEYLRMQEERNKAMSALTEIPRAHVQAIKKVLRTCQNKSPLNA
ncbi:MAG: DUF3080 family protein [Halioglobus sp.]